MNRTEELQKYIKKYGDSAWHSYARDEKAELKGRQDVLNEVRELIVENDYTQSIHILLREFDEKFKVNKQ